MSFEFHENVVLELPANLASQTEVFRESANSSKGMIIELAAIHEGLTANYNNYSAKTLENSLNSWVSPFPKPIIINHDVTTNPLGRVMAAKMDKEEDGTPFVRLQVAITDPAAIERVADMRYLTGSVGGKAESATCSVCEVDWAKASESAGIPCRHQRGKIYNGKLAYFNMAEIAFNEYSFVNVPADKNSGVRPAVRSESQEGIPEADDGWVRPAKVYALSMTNESIADLGISAESNILESMRKKESKPLYLSLKGAFLSALSYETTDEKLIYSENDTTIPDDGISNLEERTMPQTESNEGTEDILALTEELSDDVASLTTPQVDAGEEGSENPESDEAAEVVDGHDDDKKAPASDEELTDGDDKDSEEQPAADAEADESDTSTKVNELEAEVAALVEENESLREERDNAMVRSEKLAKALHKMLAERVVDTKIGVGLESIENRADLVEKHVERSAASLADSLRDLMSMSFVNSTKETPALSVKPKSLAAEDDSEEAVVVEADQGATVEEAETTSVDPDQFFVDVLMGRKKA